MVPRSGNLLKSRYLRALWVISALVFAAARETWANHVHMEGGPFIGVVLSVAVDPMNPETLYCVAYGGGVFKSWDRGASWTAINQGLPNRQVLSLVIDRKDSNRLYVGTDQGIFHSSDKGALWKPLSPILRERNIRALVLDPEDSNILYAATDNGIFQGQGEKWTRFSKGLSSKDVRAVVLSTQGELFAGTFNGVFKRNKKRSVWNPIHNGLEDKKVRALAIDPSSPDTLYAGTALGGVFKTTSGGKRWKGANQGLLNSTVLSLAITPIPHKALYAGTVDGVFMSLDGGSKWVPTGQELSFTVPTVTFDPSQPRRLYAGSGGRLFKSSDAGGKWEEASRQVNYFGPQSLSVKQ